MAESVAKLCFRAASSNPCAGAPAFPASTSIKGHHVSRPASHSQRASVRTHSEYLEGGKCSAYKPQIGIGMTREQAKAAWCEPFEINTTETASSIREQWGLPAEPRLPLF